MSDSRESNGGLLGLLRVDMVVCCGPPVLLDTGIAIGAAGSRSAAAWSSPPACADGDAARPP